jgi:hypothetical protein
LFCEGSGAEAIKKPVREEESTGFFIEAKEKKMKKIRKRAFGKGVSFLPI